jgi:DNA ligase-1
MKDIIQAFDIFEGIEATTSRTSKEDLLNSGKDNEILKNLLVLTYNPFIIFGIKKDPKADNFGDEDEPEYEYNYKVLMQLLGRLQSRTVTGKAAINELTDFLANCTDREYKWYLKVIQRDLKIGITDKTINKIWKGLVPQFTCALANSWEPKKTPKRFVADTKLDGYRCLAFNYEDRVELRSRNGHLLEGYAGIEKDVSDYLPKGFMYDGEIIGRNNSFNDIQKSAFKKGEADKDGILSVFDVTSIEEFENNDFKVTYEGRIAFLDQITDILEGARSLARVYPKGPYENTEEGMASFFDIHAENVARGEEGTMMKNLDALYKMDKSNNILKIKDFYDFDAVVTGVYEGHEGGQFEGTLGGIYVEVSSEEIEKQLPINDPKHTKKLPYIKNHTYEAKVGSGFSIPDRLRIWNNPNEIIGKTVQLQLQEMTIDKKGEPDLRFATLVCVRNDK